ncbi:MAG: hypothetical protein JNL75_08185 [Chitinophagales bacterium]|nr:hypothetical protein [Chitinophagales bacterium]
MDLVLEKEKAKKFIDSIQDEYFIKYISSLLYNYDANKNLDPHTEDGLRNRLSQSVRDLEEGRTVSMEEMRQNLAKWKK